VGGFFLPTVRQGVFLRSTRLLIVLSGKFIVALADGA
jgi:hypothetical protein